MAKGSATLTDRDRYWLGHHEACEQAGQSAKAYARENGLSIHGLYQARKRLRSLGALEAPATPRRRSKLRQGGFVRVEASAISVPRYRVRLPNGALVEWEGAAGQELGEILGAASRLG